MLLDSSKLCLLVIDIQEKLINKIFDKEKIRSFTLKTIEVFELLNLPILYCEQYPKGLGLTTEEIKKKLDDVEARKFEKTTFSCFATSDYESLLKPQVKQILLCGIETHICVLQTAYDLINKGYNVFLVDEATGSRKPMDRKLGLERMTSMGVNLINFEMLIFEIIRDSKHPKFKDLSRLIK
tara:strand:+ start:95 stop:640 length:546 start_codon:yes stop_codon:yes gene_type:complete